MKASLFTVALLSLLFHSQCMAETLFQSEEDEALCSNYCTQVMGDPGVCTIENQENYTERIVIYPTVDACMETCSTFPTDAEEGAVSGNSVQCRTEHAILAQGDEGPVKHCPHAAPGGGGVCVDRSPCLAYCLFYYDRVEEGECPAVDQWGGEEHIGMIDRSDFVFQPNPQCMQTCANFAGAGQAWEMSGDSANCRQQYYLMAHRRIDPDVKDQVQRKSLCNNAHPFESQMCQGYTFGDYYKTTEPDPCKELCYNDQLTCEGSYGTPEQCMASCSAWPTGVRQSTTGDTAQCRLTWMQYAFFSDETMQPLLCAFGAEKSPVCTDTQHYSETLKLLLPADQQHLLHSH